MSKYYYLVSQLPFLKFEEPLPLKEEYFLEEAKKWLSKKDFAVLEHADINEFIQVKKKEPQILKEFKRYEYFIRKELSLFRQARKQGREYKPEKEINEMVSSGNPLQIEDRLLRLRWGFLEESETKYNFDLNYIVVYFLKMQIIKRHKVFDKEKGLERFKEMSLPNK